MSYATIKKISSFAGNRPKLAKYLDLSKGLGVLGAMTSGMVIANVVSNKINNKIFSNDKPESRKFSPKDFVAQIDDIVLSLFYCKFSFINTKFIEKFIPVFFAFSGKEAGVKKEKTSKVNTTYVS
jgi:hypothetical protein